MEDGAHWGCIVPDAASCGRDSATVAEVRVALPGRAVTRRGGDAGA